MTPEADTELMTAVAIQVGFVVLMVVVLVFVLRFKAREKDRRRAIWQQFANDNRLQLKSVSGGLFRRNELSLHGQIGELKLEISTYPVRVGKSTQTWVRVRTSAPGPAGSFSAKRENLLTRAGALLGMGGVAVDQGEFDQQYLVQSAPEDLARDVLDEPLRRQLQGLTREPRLSYSEGVTELVWRAGKDSFEQLSDAVQLHVMLRAALRRMSQTVGR